MRRGRALAGIAPCIGCVLLLGLASPVLAASNCSIMTVSDVAFGTYNVFDASPLDSTGTLRIRCTGNASNITVDLSRGNAPTYSPRQMLWMAEVLSYNLYIDAARTMIWGDGTGGTSHYGLVDPPNGNSFDLTVYGRVTALQDVSAGAYSDTIVATVNF